MKILTIQHAIPTKRITNEDLLEAIHERSKDRLNQNDQALVEKRIRKFLDAAGTQVRYILNDGEKAIDFVLEAGRKALKAVEVPLQGIDFIIYTGVGRGWIEPAMANVIQSELHLLNASCFDLLEACAGWLRALQVAHSLIHNRIYRCGMIVNCECSFSNYANFEINHIQDLEHRFASFTVGEAATATIVNDENRDDDFYFKFKTFGEHFGLCIIPLDNMADFIRIPANERHVPGKFFSLSRELITITVKKILETFESDPVLSREDYDICFGHAASEKASDFLRRKLHLSRDIYFSTHPSHGNTVSASIPLGMSLALEENRFQRGNKTLIVVGSAGISVGFASFTF